MLLIYRSLLDLCYLTKDHPHIHTAGWFFNVISSIIQNMANPIWNDKEQRWILRIYEGGQCVKKFTSVKKGPAGARECNLRRSEYLAGHTAANENATVSQEWQRFLSEIKTRYCPEGASNIESYGKNNILPTIGSRRIRGMTAIDFQQVLNTATKKNGDLLSHKSMMNLKAVLSNFMKFCKKDGYEVPESSELYFPKVKAAEKSEKKALSEDQIQRLFDDTKPYADFWYMNFFRFLCATGVRPGEAISLTPADYDGTFITINKSVNVNGRLTPGKTSNSHRRFSLNSKAKIALESQLAIAKKLGSKYIFCNQDGDIISETTALKRWKYLTEPSRLNAPGTNLYSLRHTFITQVAPLLPESTLKSLVGHSVSMDSYGVYGHITDKQLQTAAEIMDKVF